MNVHIYQSDLTGHWLVDARGTRENPSHVRFGYRLLSSALTEAWRIVTRHPTIYKDVTVQR